MSKEKKKVISVSDQIEKIKDQELKQQAEFLKGQGNTDPVMAFLLDNPDTLKAQYRAAKEAYVKAQDCSRQKNLDEHEKALTDRAIDFMRDRMQDFAEHAKSSIGNKQSQAIRFSQKLNDHRRLDVTVNAVRIKKLEPEEVQKPLELQQALKETFVDFKLKDTVSLRDFRRRTLSLLTGDNKPKDDTFEYALTLNIRERTKAEEKTDIAEKTKQAEEEQIAEEIEAEGKTGTDG